MPRGELVDLHSGLHRLDVSYVLYEAMDELMNTLWVGTNTISYHVFLPLRCAAKVGL